MSGKDIKDYVKKRYGSIAQRNEACCPSCESAPSTTNVAFRIGYTEADLNAIPEAASLGLGCGNPVAFANIRERESVLDLGSGGGIDVFLAAKKVGPYGRAIGVDMTPAMVQKAQNLATKHGYDNVEFRLGEIEKLPIDDETIDVIISNCVINLSPNKAKVFREAYRVLKPNGRILISDLVTEGEIPLEVKKSFEAWACCIAGALEKEHYLTTIRQAGFRDVAIVAESTFNVDITPDLKGKITSIQVKAQK